ncbi:MAG TPA: Nramp family divalent metal transporter [Thermoanaerobaculia bacterium]|jgi:manganese transport protein|nr:Nramp family divalent metal transporter [Thermoanaerobaculia bacterium]
MRASEPRAEPTRSLSEVHSSVEIPSQLSFWRRLFAFAGPAYLVSVGYMDPGNWATDIAAGSKFGYALIWVLVMSNLMAILLQSFSARLGIATGMDLAQACRAMFPRKVTWVLWILCEIAIAACDLAEVLGSAIGLQLLFGMPLLFAVFITVLDTFVLLLLHHRGVRLMEAFILTLVLTIGVCLAIEVFLSRPEWGAMASGLAPSLPGEGALYLAIGILGATVMPHNLYLHSALVQSRRLQHTPAGIRAGIRFNTIDSVIALNGALLVNAALLVMAAATFFRAGMFDVAEIQDAHRLLEPLLGARIAPMAFAIALIAAGQSSTITGTLAGQVVMEGFVNIRLRPIARRLITRALAIIPAVITIVAFGERATGDLLVLSQVILSLQLSFAVIPLIQMVSDRRWMGQYAINRWLQLAGWVVAGAIAALNLKLVFDAIVGAIRGAESHAWVLLATVVPLALGLVGLLIYVVVVPLLERWRGQPLRVPAGVHGPRTIPEIEPPRSPRTIAAAVDFSRADKAVLSYAVTLARAANRGARVLLFHVVESGGALVMGGELRDSEARGDQERLELYAGELAEHGVEAKYDLGFGDPAGELARLVEHHRPDVILLGSHGHRGVGDLVHGTSVERLRHQVKIPVMVIPAD